MDNVRFKLENTVIRSYAHLRSLELKGYFKAIKDLHFDCLPNQYSNNSMTRMQGSQYFMQSYNMDTNQRESYCVDIDTLKAKRLEVNISDINSCLIEGQYMLVIEYDDLMTIYKDLQDIGQIEFESKYDLCKNGYFIFGRYAKQAGHTVYAVDR